MTLTLDVFVATATLVLVVSGLLLIFGMLHVINLAQTGLMAIGVFSEVTYTKHGLSFWEAIPLATATAAAVGGAIEIVVVRRLYARPLDTILATWGISLATTQVLILIYGSETQPLNIPTPGATSVLGTVYPTYRLLLIVFAAALLVVLGLIVRLTPLGLTVRAVMSNEPLARAHGINTVRARQLTFIAGSGLAGFAGAILGPLAGVDTSFGLGYFAPAFLAALLAGRNLRGLATACLVIAGAQVLFANYANPIWSQAFVIGVAVVLLRFLPNGFTWRRA
jgi:branched-chain amino acid transport system permease protein